MNAMEPETSGSIHEQGTDGSLIEAVLLLASRWRLLLLGPFLVGSLALGVAFLIPPTYTARTSLLSPQQQQGIAAAALANLGALSGLTGVSTRTPGDQYVALLQSVSIQDRLIAQFNLLDVYDVKFRVDARRALEGKVKVSLGKKDGLIIIEVDDRSPQRAADMANQHVEELRHLTSQLALTEAQQRRLFFEQRMKETRERLTLSQVALQSSGFNAGALRSEPKAAAESYARARAEVTAAEVRLQTLRRSLTDLAPEVQSLQSTLNALREQVALLESNGSAKDGPDYVTKYRDFKYQETLLDLFSRQYELARLDESREGALIQVVDPASPPERKSKPPRLLIGLVATLFAELAIVAFVLVRHRWFSTSHRSSQEAGIARLRAKLGDG